MRAVTFLLSFIITVLLFAVPASAAEQPAGPGVTDAGSWSLDERTVHKLEGPWTFYWRQLLDSDTRTVVVHISSLRKKIKTNPSEPVFIQNIRGYGYKLNSHPYNGGEPATRSCG